MKLIQLEYEKPLTRSFSIVVEVPDDFSETDAPSLFSDQQLAEWPEEDSLVYETSEPAECKEVIEISDDEGTAHFRLVSGRLEKAH